MRIEDIAHLKAKAEERRKKDRAAWAEAERLFRRTLLSQEQWMLQTEEGQRAKLDAYKQARRSDVHPSYAYYDNLSAAYGEWIAKERERKLPKRLRPLSEYLGDVVAELVRASAQKAA